MATETEVGGLLKEWQATGHKGVLTFEPRLLRLCTKGMDAMRRALCLLGSFCLLAAGCMTTRPAAPVAARTRHVVAADQEVHDLYTRLSELSDMISRNTRSPKLWRYQLAQGDVLVQLAARSKTDERDDWLRMAVDSYQSAAVLSPDNEFIAHQRLFQIASAYAESRVSNYAVLQEMHVDYLRVLGKAGVNPTKSQELLRDRLVGFVEEFPKAPEAPQVVLEVGQISESLGKIHDARRFYRYLTEHSPDHAVAQQAGRALWRLGLAGEPMHLKLPLLFAAPGDQAFDVDEVHSKVVVAFFWSSTSTSAQLEEDFRALKQLTDRYRDHGLEVVYVNLDNDPAQAKAFLSGRLTAGVHVFQPGGLDSPLAVRYGIQTFPQAILIGKDGVVMRNALPAAQLESEVASACAHLVRARWR
jgi:hypothetical protein